MSCRAVGQVEQWVVRFYVFSTLLITCDCGGNYCVKAVPSQTLSAARALRFTSPLILKWVVNYLLEYGMGGCWKSPADHEKGSEEGEMKPEKENNSLR